MIRNNQVYTLRIHTFKVLEALPVAQDESAVMERQGGRERVTFPLNSD
jgi:hypothetical protein